MKRISGEPELVGPAGPSMRSNATRVSFTNLAHQLRDALPEHIFARAPAYVFEDQRRHAPAAVEGDANLQGGFLIDLYHFGAEGHKVGPLAVQEGQLLDDCRGVLLERLTGLWVAEVGLAGPEQVLSYSLNCRSGAPVRLPRAGSCGARPNWSSTTGLAPYSFSPLPRDPLHTEQVGARFWGRRCRNPWAARTCP